MKICFIASNLDVSNGDGRFSYSLVKSLQNLGIESLVLVNKGEQEILGAKAVLETGGNFQRFILNPLKIAREIKKFGGVDVIHAFDAWPRGIWAWLAGLLSRTPVGMTIYATYGVEPLTRFPHSLLLKAAYKNSVFNAAISRTTAQKIKNQWAGAKIDVVNQGISFDDYQAPVKYPRVTEGPYILTIAYMKPRKGYETAIPVFARLKKDFPDLKYVVRAPVSNEPYRLKIQKLIEELGVGQDIIWLPRLEEERLIDVYKHAKVFFLPSVSSHPTIFEGFGSVYVEAQACGVPVVTSRGGGQEDAMADGKTGFLIDEGSVEQGYQALKKLLENKELYGSFSRNAKEFARSMDWKYKAKEYYDQYQLRLKSAVAGR